MSKNKTRVKICGITNAEDALAAVRFGADAIGFVFAKSPRRVTVGKARSIAGRINPRILKVGVFVNEKPKMIRSVARQCRLQAVQLHGDETADDCRKLKHLKIIKAFRVNRDFVARTTSGYPVNLIMLEAPGILRGGSGKSWNWKKMARAKFKKPIIVTGGLKVQNVKRAIRLLKPYAVDVSSGIEVKAGKKNHALMRKFIQNAKEN